MNLDKGKVDKYKEKHEKDMHTKSASSPVLNGEGEPLKTSTKQRRPSSEFEDEGEDESKHHRHRKHRKTHHERKHREHGKHRHKSSDREDHRHFDAERESDSRHHSSKHRHSDKSGKQQSTENDLPQQKQKHDHR